MELDWAVAKAWFVKTGIVWVPDGHVEVPFARVQGRLSLPVKVLQREAVHADAVATWAFGMFHSPVRQGARRR